MFNVFLSCRTHGREQPDVIIISTGLWHMLHIGDPKGYASALIQLGNLSDGLVNKLVTALNLPGCSGCKLLVPACYIVTLQYICYLIAVWLSIFTTCSA